MTRKRKKALKGVQNGRWLAGGEPRGNKVQIRRELEAKSVSFLASGQSKLLA